MQIKRSEHRRMRRLGYATAVAGMVLAVVGIATSPADADNSNPGPPSNNGTVKLDGLDLNDGPGHTGKPNDPDETDPDNDPHLTCGFQLEFFNFDAGQLADIVFTAHPPTGENGVLSEQLQVVISNDGSGGAENDPDAVFDYDVASFDLSQFTSVHDVHGWHIKLDLTVYDADGKKVPGAQKHKVFWAEGCDNQPPCDPETDENQCEPPCVPSTENNQCEPPCVPSTENNQCEPPCERDCTPPPPPPPFDECPLIVGNQPAGTDCTPPPPVDECPDDPGLQSNAEQCTVPEVEPEVVVPTVEPEVVVPTADPPVVQVEGEVITKTAPAQLPRTGTNTQPLLEVGFGLILLGAGAMLFGRERTASI